jgi:hypothetical protein
VLYIRIVCQSGVYCPNLSSGSSVFGFSLDLSFLWKLFSFSSLNRSYVYVLTSGPYFILNLIVTVFINQATY